MLGKHLTEIDVSLSTINPELPISPNRQGRAFSYFSALKNLKDVDSKIAVVKNRIKLYTYKEEKEKYSVARFYQQKEERLRELHHQQNQMAKKNIQLIRQISQRELNTKSKINQQRKVQSNRRILKAKRILTEGKYRNHEQIKEKSIQNRKQIESFKQYLFCDKKKKHQEIQEQEKKKQQKIRKIQEMKLQQIKEQWKLQTNFIFKKVKQKQSQLQQLEEKCQFLSNKQLQTLLKHKGRQLKKIQYTRRSPLKMQTSHSTLQTYKDTPITTLSGALSYVIIT